MFGGDTASQLILVADTRQSQMLTGVDKWLEVKKNTKGHLVATNVNES